MKYFTLALFFLLFVPPAQAHVPNIVTQDSLKDIEAVTEPEVSNAYYGTLNGFPHTYEILAAEPFTLYAQVLVPDIDSSTDTVSSIIVRQVEGSGRVTEVARLNADQAEWESFYEFFGGDSYRRGPSFESEVGPGTYRVEVHSPNNVEKYVLVIGKREESGGLGYFELVGRIADVKAFFGKPRIAVIQSPLVYVPLIIVLLGFGAYLYRRRRNSHG